MGRHSAGERYASAAPPAAPQQPGSRQPSRTARRRVLPVFAGLAVLAVLAVAAGTASMVLGSGKVSAGPADHRAAYPAGTASAAAKPEPAVAGPPVVIGFAGVARAFPAGRPAQPRRKSAPPVTSAPARAPATQAPSLVSALQDLPVNTELNRVAGASVGQGRPRGAGRPGELCQCPDDAGLVLQRGHAARL